MNLEALDHDKIFKELFTNFFVEFVELFLPDVFAYMDTSYFEFLDKEIFTDIATGDKHEVDIVVKVRFRQMDGAPTDADGTALTEAFFLIHIENQSTARSDFPRRMFQYFARLYEKFNLPVYPVVIFSYDTPLRPEPKRHSVTFPGFEVCRFNYRVIQLNRLSWRKYVNQPNPVAAALMAKMKIAEGDRPKVKLQCLRLLLTLKLDPAKSELIFLFVDRYLRLSMEEQRQYNQAMAKLPEMQKEQAMELVSSWRLEGREEGRQEGRAEMQEMASSWRLEGREEGRQEGRAEMQEMASSWRLEGREEGRAEGIEEGMRKAKVELAMALLTRKFGTLSSSLQTQLQNLSSAQLNDLALAILDFTILADAEDWLAARN